MGGTNGQGEHTPLLVDSKAAAAMLGISTRTLFDLEQSGTLPAVRIGRLVRYSVASIQSWANAGCPAGLSAASKGSASEDQGVNQ